MRDKKGRGALENPVPGDLLLLFDGKQYFRQNVNSMRRKTTIYVEADVLRATKIAAARTGKRDYQVVEEALRAYLGLELLERVSARSKLTEDEALDLAYRELHQSRRA
jgi:ActR/RegA family two-component response regulator